MARSDSLAIPGVEALLCERCGYVLDGLDDDVACPECGKAIRESMPRRRVGTPWQQRRGFDDWVLTVWLVMRHPRGVWERVQVRSETWWRVRAFNLVSINCLVAAMVPGALTMVLGPPGHDQGAAAALVLLGPILFFPILWGATWMEVRGIRFFGKQRGWRVDKDVAWAVCSHASCAWWVAGVGVYVAMRLHEWLDPLIDKLLATPLGALLPVNPLVPAVWWLGKAAIGFVAGMLVFESIVYFGVRSMRFANRGTGKDA
ncbi:MAG: hypothetical protein K2Q20_01400 [Phycisphaerales bacterium]|nr:hypothetical protein [Phycisphaerales bacterium]